MRKRSFVAVALTALLAAALLGMAGCTGSGNYQPELKSAEVAPPVIGEDGTLRVGVNTENPPLAGMGSGKIIGIDVDIAAAIADELGLKLSVVDVGSDPAAAIANGDVDIVMGIDDSSSEGDFWRSPSYLPTGIAVFALSADAGIPSSDSGATFAAQVSSKSAWAVSNEYGENALTPTDSLKEAFEALQAGSVQYVAADAIIGLYAAHGQGLDASIVAMLMSPSGYCMGVSSENTDLQTAAGDVLARLVENGTIDVIERKWLGATVALDGLTVLSDQQTAAVGTDDGSSSDGSGNGDDSSDSNDSGSGDGSDSGDGSSDSDGSGSDNGDGSGDAGDDSGASDDSGNGDGSDNGDGSGDSGDTNE